MSYEECRYRAKTFTLIVYNLLTKHKLIYLFNTNSSCNRSSVSSYNTRSEDLQTVVRVFNACSSIIINNPEIRQDTPPNVTKLNNGMFNYNFVARIKLSTEPRNIPAT